MTLIGLSYAEIFAALLGMLAIATLAAIGVLASRHARAARAAVQQPPKPPKLIPKLSSDALATMIVQGLVDSKIVPTEKFDDALQVTARKIDLRKALGDY